MLHNQPDDPPASCIAHNMNPYMGVPQYDAAMGVEEVIAR